MDLLAGFVVGGMAILNARFVGLFLQTNLATRLNRLGRREGDASDATPEIAGLQEKYDIGTVDWAVIDASGTPEQTLRRSQIQIAHDGGDFDLMQVSVGPR